jgi:leucyl aminopeptidase
MKTALFALACAVGASVVAAEETRESGLRLIATSETERSWMTMDQVHELIYAEVGFIDVTDEVSIPSSKLKTTQRASSIPTTLSQQSMVNLLTPKVSATNMEATIRHLSTAYTTRYYTNQQSVEAVNWLKGQYESASKIEGATVELFTHSFLQPSLIARIPGTSHPEEVVVIGGHIDSTSSIGNAPGADDDASGSSAVLEVFRVLNAAGIQFNRTISFEAYAAEEVGLRGSADIARKYAQDGVNVVAMLQLDMIGFKGNNPRIGLITDYTSSELNAFVRLMIDGYLEIGYENARCGYGCSDHASFTAQGFPAIFPFELPFGEHNSNIHTPRDTIDKLDMTYAAEFAKLGVAFATELGSL